MRLLPETIRGDYKPVRGKLQRNLIVGIFRKLFPQVSFHIDFQDGDIRKIGADQSEIKVAPPSLFEIAKILRNPNYYFPQSFVEGKWFVSEGDLADFVVLATRRKGHKARNTGASLGIARFVRHFYKHYINIEATRETKHHYNEDPRIYELVLGPSMIYSCAFFDSDDDDLEAAQKNKLEKTFTRVTPDPAASTVLYWRSAAAGVALPFFASEHTNAKIDAISIARSQIDYANETLSQKGQAKQNQITHFTAKIFNYIGNLNLTPMVELSVLGCWNMLGKLNILLIFQKYVDF